MHMGNNKKTAGKAQAEMLLKFNERLATFPSQVGKRNPQLLGLINCGLRAGLTDDQIEDVIIEGSGKPPLTSAEIRHALDTAHKTTGLFRPNAAKRDSAPPLGPRAKNYVPEMMSLGAGATLETLKKLSPVTIPENEVEQTKLFLSTLYADDEHVFTGDKKDSGILGNNIKTVAGWLQSAPRGPYLITNPLTGAQGMTKAGQKSYRCMDCISAYRYMLVEADDTTLEDQWAFWAGVISSKTLPLRSLVYSGNDSIHGLIELAANSPEEWRVMQGKVMFAVAHPSAPKSQKADEACNNPDRLSRLAGATNPKTGKLQPLLWISTNPLGL